MYWMDALYSLFGLLVIGRHHSWSPWTWQRSVTLETPQYTGEYGSAVLMSAKQRPQASPGPGPGADPNES